MGYVITWGFLHAVFSPSILMLLLPALRSAWFGVEGAFLFFLVLFS